VQPYTIVEAGGLLVGVLGFTNVDSPVTSDPRHMTGLQFLPYEDALEHWAPLMRARGVDTIVVLLHDGFEAVTPLIPLFRKHGIHAVAIGHHHQGTTLVDDGGTPDAADDVLVCNSGSFLRSYCRIDLTFTHTALTAHAIKMTAVEQPLADPPPPADAVLSPIVAAAEHSANQIGGEVLVENTALLKRGRAGPLGQVVVRAWLDALPYAQVAITNAGGLRQDLAAGPVRVRDVVSVLPFNNYLLVVDLTGAQLKAVLESEESIVAGVAFKVATQDGKRVVSEMADSAGQPIPPERRVKVVINDFMYRGGDRYQFAKYDPEPEETAIDWREPVLRSLREKGKRGEKLEAPR
jgi:2',3'-cyclic-nucleotide 2'-phosphodiesterase (5'-nucleotidase family)